VQYVTPTSDRGTTAFQELHTVTHGQVLTALWPTMPQRWWLEICQHDLSKIRLNALNSAIKVWHRSTRKPNKIFGRFTDERQACSDLGGI
jgi:hypothetical protein